MNKLGRAIERAMGMDDAVWERHANPWSGWTRVAIPPMLGLAITMLGKLWFIDRMVWIQRENQKMKAEG